MHAYAYTLSHTAGRLSAAEVTYAYDYIDVYILHVPMRIYKYYVYLHAFMHTSQERLSAAEAVLTKERQMRQ